MSEKIYLGREPLELQSIVDECPEVRSISEISISQSRDGYFAILPDGVTLDIEAVKLASAKRKAIALSDQITEEKMACGHKFEGRFYSLSQNAQINALGTLNKTLKELEGLTPKTGIPVRTLDSQEVVRMNASSLRAKAKAAERTKIQILAESGVRCEEVILCDTVEEVEAVVASWNV